MISEQDIVIYVPSEATEALAAALEGVTLEDMEAAAPTDLNLSVESAPAWKSLTKTVQDAFRRHDYVLLRGLDPAADPRTLMAATAILGGRFLTYSKGHVVKVLSMSPWSRGLAHTGAEGFFHTDLNASPAPPALTAIQCVKPDPGAPEYGHNRVARLDRLLEYLRKHGKNEAIAFMTRQDVEMANERSPTSWRGKIVSDGILRFHPETVRTASRRRGELPPEDVLMAIQEAAFAVSTPMSLGCGDILLFSNHRTLHYRSECSINFIRFPMEFEARQIHVLHAIDDRLIG